MKRLLIEDLIIAPRQIEVKIGTKTVKLWIRPVEDPERSMATALARRASRHLRKMLSDKTTEQFDLLVQEELDSADPAALRKIWVNGKLIERAIRIRNASLEDREYVPEPEGEAVTPKEMDQYEDEVDDAEERREVELTKALENALKELDEEAAKIPDKELYEAAIPSIIEVKCNQAYEAEFVNQLIFRCTFEDKNLERKAFRDVGQVYRLLPAAKTKLVNEHIGLMLEPEAVKN